MAEKITVTVLTKDSEATLRECLEALRRFSEVVVLDSGSSDRTIEIARSFPNVVVHEHPFLGFGPMKNLALDKASNDWILSVDSDEVVSVELAEEILGMQLDEACVYAVGRDNHYHGRLINGCGWDNDRVERLFNLKEVRFNDKMIHEGLEIGEGVRVVMLGGRLKHYAYDNASQLIGKLQHYSTLWAEERKGKKRVTALQAFLYAAFSFLKYYILKRGWLYGYEGLLISVSNANGVFYKYIKLYETSRR